MDELSDMEEFLEKCEEFNGILPSNSLKASNTQPEDPLFMDKKPGQPSQYSLYSDGYKATTDTVKSMPPGCYDITIDQYGVYAVPTLPPSGILLELPEMRSDDIIKIVENFWNSEKDYKEGNEFVIGGAIYKQGVILYGPAGSGKSSCIKLLSKKLIERGGLVFYASENPAFISEFLTDFARIEKDRKCIIILEDLDSLIQQFGESKYLEMLDSAKTINNALFIATTNYPERLDPRIYNRPGRFSNVVKVGLPGVKAREAYLKAILKDHRDVSYIVEHSDGFTIDHLTSLCNAVYREKKELIPEIERLRTLFRVPKSEEGAKIGF